MTLEEKLKAKAINGIVKIGVPKRNFSGIERLDECNVIREVISNNTSETNSDANENKGDSNGKE